MCGVRLKCMATSQVFLFVFIEDLLFLNLTLFKHSCGQADKLDIAFLAMNQIYHIRLIAKRTKSKNRMQFTEFPARISQYKRILREKQEM